MTLSLYDAAIPVYRHMLGNLLTFLEKGEAHAKATGVELSTLLEARLAPDMFPLLRQIQIASDAAKNSAARLAGQTPPSFPDEETTWAELEARLRRTIAFIDTIRPEQLAGAETRTIELPLPDRTLSFSGRDFLFQFSLPNFLFHVVTVYGILRSQGVPLGKMDYLAAPREPAAA